MADDLDRATPIGAELLLKNDLQELHTLDLAGAAQGTRIDRPHATILHQLGNFTFRLGVIAGDKNVEWLAGDLTLLELFDNIQTLPKQQMLQI